MNKALIITILTLLLKTTFADEGMWLPLLVGKNNYEEMQKMGCKLTPEQIYNINQNCLKDAIVSFGNGCTGEIISSEGLVLTNHHCGYGAIQSHSTVEHDYLTDGFWAKSKAEELKTPGLFVSFLVRMEDVSQQALKGVDEQMTLTARNKAISDNIEKIKADATKNTLYNADVKSMFSGNAYYLFVYEVYNDVRLVGAPPSAIGKFGGDTDNWMWPRHTCDFSMFRVYMSPDGKPASYSEKNIPLKPKHYLPVSLNGVKEKDFTMVMGYPGTTDRYLTSYGIKLAINTTNPTTVKIRERKLQLLKIDMNASDEVRIKYAAKYAGTSNYWKYYIGQTKGLKRLNVYGDKVNIENQFVAWVNADASRKAKYDSVIPYFSQAYQKLDQYALFNTYYNEFVLRGTDITNLTSRFNGMYDAMKANADLSQTIPLLKEKVAGSFKDFYWETDKKVFTALLEMFYKDIPAEQRPGVFSEITKKYKGNVKKYADVLFEKSIFANEDKMYAFLSNPTLKTLEEDPAFRFFRSVYEKHGEIQGDLEDANTKLEKAKRWFLAGLMEMQPDRKFYPNANSTMRLTYGSVKDYYPADGIRYNYFTTLKGIMEKEELKMADYKVPPRLKELYQKKDYGRYADENGDMKTCFTSNNDITGGNSGSPVINGEGQLIGLAFDGNWEAMSGNIAFEHNLQRCINVDIRYVLFIVDKYAGAENLINEMTIVK